MLLPEFGNLLCSIVCVSEFYAAKHVVLNLCLFVAPYLGELLNQNLLPKCFTLISQSLKNMFIYEQYVYNAVISCLTSMFECAYLSFLFETLRSRVKYKPVGMFNIVFFISFFLSRTKHRIVQHIFPLIGAPVVSNIG
jgi:hypothetical protein